MNTITIGSAGVFGDTTVHVSDTAGFIRSTNLQRATVIQADSVRFRGTMRVRDGQPVLDQAEAFFVAAVTTPALENVTAAMADSADGGRLDAALVRLDSAVVTDTATVTGGVLVTVDDGSGPIEIDIRQATLIDPSQLIPTAAADFTGLLVPTGAGRWRLRPRAAGDIVIR